MLTFLISCLQDVVLLEMVTDTIPLVDELTCY